MVAVCVVLEGCAARGVLAPAGPVAEANRWILFDSVTIMLVVVVPTIAAIIVFAWWFREGNARARRQPDFTYSGRIELVVWSIPLFVILFLSGVIWVGSHRMDPWAPLPSTVRPLDVQVIALDWKWLFIIPEDGIASVNRLVIPAGRPIRLRLTSASVMNAFFVPRLGSMVYAMNGMETRLNLQADRPGVYRGLSAHYSGAGFPDMAFAVRALAPADYATWARRHRAAALPPLGEDGYAKLAQQGRSQPGFFRATAPQLFSAIVSQRIGPSAGPTPEARQHGLR